MRPAAINRSAISMFRFDQALRLRRRLKRW
jgi:hypothetical protein